MASLEIAVETYEEALIAYQNGAQSVEVVAALSKGGLTPDVNLVTRIAAELPFRVNAIVRVHDQGFIYTRDEIDLMLTQIKQLARAGAASNVFAGTSPDGRLDIDLIRRAADAASPASITVHRALDTSLEPEASLEKLIGIVPRVLTSGPGANVWDGRHGLAHWVRRFGSHFSFVCSGGLTAAQTPEILSLTGAQEFHYGGAARINGIVSPEKIRELKALLSAPVFIPAI